MGRGVDLCYHLRLGFPRIWNDPSVEPRERKRILRLLIEDVTLIKGETIQVHVRLRGGATRSLTVEKPLPIAQIRKTKPEVVTEIDRLLNDHCDREVAEILHGQGRRTWEGEPFNLKKIQHIRNAFRPPPGRNSFCPCRTIFRESGTIPRSSLASGNASSVCSSRT